jgi:hypothetical protein
MIVSEKREDGKESSYTDGTYDEKHSNDGYFQCCWHGGGHILALFV